MKGSTGNSLYKLFRKGKYEKHLKEDTVASEKYECIFVKVGMWQAEECLLTSFEFLNYILITLIKISENKYIQTFLL